MRDIRDEQVTLTWAQIQDALTTVSHLTNFQYVGLGRRGISMSNKPLTWDESDQRWRHHSTVFAERYGMACITLQQCAGLHECYVETTMPGGLLYLSERGTFIVRQAKGPEPEVSVSLAEVTDMLILFCHLTGKEYAGLYEFGISYSREHMEFREDRWRSCNQNGHVYNRPFRCTCLDGILDDDFEDTYVYTKRRKEVLHETKDGTVLTFRRDTDMY